ncbi:MAG TPA: hypothetical protein VMH28_11320 [Candidatus Acidoferrales bacterium]|nr:hypothetical protein [Candidatus Acidoferrales bacterium]
MCSPQPAPHPARGLCQINLTVPVGLANGDQQVVAGIAGLSTQSNALLKIAP